MPPDTDIFMLREKEKQQKLQVFTILSSFWRFQTNFKLSHFKDRENNKHLKVHEKLTHSRKMIEGMKAGLKPDISDDENPDGDDVLTTVFFLQKL